MGDGTENFGVVSVNLSGAPALIELFLIHSGVGDPFVEAFEDEFVICRHFGDAGGAVIAILLGSCFIVSPF